MGSPQSLSFLRPYLSSSFRIETLAYARFYALASSHRRLFASRSLAQNSRDSGTAPGHPEVTSEAGVSSASIRSSGPHAERDAGAGSPRSLRRVTHEDQLAHFDQLGAGVKDRVKELRHANVLKHPRISSPPETKQVLEVPSFIKGYGSRDTTGDANVAEEVTLRGRVRSVRRAGSKLAFIDITQQLETVQVMVNWKSTLPSRREDMDEAQHLRRFKSLFHLIRRGDVISVPGRAKRTDTGALCLAATDVPTILSPSIASVPESLSENRMLHRHMDLLVNETSWGTLLLRSQMLSELRSIFSQEMFIEVSTPILAANASGAIAQPFETFLDRDAQQHAHSDKRALALRIAPELWLKRLIVGGLDRVYELGPAFRNEGQDASHNPEFTTCEFYRAYASLEDLTQWTEATLCRIAASLPRIFDAHPGLQGKIPDPKAIEAFSAAPGGSQEERERKAKTDIPSPRYPRVEFLPTLEEKLGIRFKDLNLHLPEGGERLVSALRERNALPTRALDSAAASSSMAKIFDALSEQYLESLYPGQPFFLVHQPAFMSPLSKWFVCPRTSVPVAARAELFYNGMELANMYEEENSPVEQRRKFLARLGGREDLGAWAWNEGGGDVDVALARPENFNSGSGAGGDAPSSAQSNGEGRGEGNFVDEQYVEALLAGMPPTGGWGCGIDRLVMLFSGQDKISQVLSFGSLRHVRAFAERSKQLSQYDPARRERD